MLEKALTYIHTSLDQFVKKKLKTDESKVINGTLIRLDGSVPQLNQNKLIISLINIERERLKPFYNPRHVLSNKELVRTPPSERFNLDILLVANFDDYSESLKFLNAALLFFQLYPSISANDYSNIPQGLSKLEFEVEKITYREMQNLWSAMGAKYQPSIIYKVRLITIDGDEIKELQTGINSVSNPVSQ
ncbi:MAG: DUF4255 domain-containing protein [Bacteroidetes bacterium]|nr:DUF4255 domain-containing protein [Bacteroidota bacterium]